MNKSYKTFFIYFLSTFFLVSILTLIYIFQPKKLQIIDNNIQDIYFQIRGELPKTDNVYIIDIDEKSLRNFGQWPWSRELIANLIENLTNANIGIIGFDIVFAEDDKTSPHMIAKTHPNIFTQENILNYDQIFANAIQKTNVILGYQFLLQENTFLKLKKPNISTIIIERNKHNNITKPIHAYGTLLNIPTIQEVATSSGFVNNIPDLSGITRSVPLLIEYEGTLYPSFALEIIRNIYGNSNIIINYSPNGIDSIQLDSLKIPTDPYGRLLLNYRGYEKHFEYISAYDILNHSFDMKKLEGKIALIGTSAMGLHDLRATPYESIFPGVEIHANAIDNILLEDFIAQPSWAMGADIFHITILTFFVVFLIAYTSYRFYIPTLIILIGLEFFTLYHLMFTFGIILNSIFIYTTIFFAILNAIAIKYFFETKQTLLLKNKFSSKVSANILSEIINNENSSLLQSSKKEITVLFSDIRNFTQITEQINDAQKTVQYLNRYIEPMSNTIIEYEGIIDKYIGDSIMAYWNAPIAIKNHCDKAVECAIKQIKLLDQFNIDQQYPIHIGIGIHTGEAMFGEIGTFLRNDFTIIGDTVNIASRLETLTKTYNCSIIISEQVVTQLTQPFAYEYLDSVILKGKSTPIKIYKILID